MLLENLKNKKILILGFGKEGIDNYLALRKLFPDKVLGIADKKTAGEFDKKTQSVLKNDNNLKLHLGNNYLQKIGDYDFILKTPGIPAKVYQKLLKKGAAVSSQTEIFFDNFPGKIIGVTGTKGKGTTSTLIHQILKKAGLKVFLGGNIGKPVFQKLLALRLAPPAQGENFIFIYELSDHQLQNLKKSPHIAVFLNLFSDHLDYYDSFAEYQKAKANIALHQAKNDFLIYNASDKKVKAIAQKSQAQKIPFSLKTPLTPFERSLKKHYQLKGDFNFLNLRAAVLAARLFNVPNEIILQAVKTFKPLPHRLEFAGKYKNIEFYDDSMSTIPEVAVAALKALPKTTTLLVGGSDKGSDYSKMSQAISKSKVKNLIVLGKGTGEKILEGAKLLPLRKELSSFGVGSMQEAVKIAYQKTPKGGICLLSPGSASFNIFKDYKDRGEQFKKYVRYFSKKNA